MPGAYKPPPIGDRPAKAGQIMAAVYEQARSRGYSKKRAAKIGWGAVKRAGFDPDHFDYELSLLKEIVNQLKAKDAYLDMQAKKMGTRYHPSLLRRPQSRLVSSARRVVGVGRRAAAPIRAIRGTRTRSASRPTPTRSSSTSARSRLPGYIADPSKLVKPIDLPGYDNLNNVRFVPRDDTPGYYPTRGLTEGQIVLPQNQFMRSLEVIEGHPEYSHAELLDEDGDGFIDRLVFRGPKDAKNPTKHNVGLFVDIAKPLKTERLAVENWTLSGQEGEE